MYSWKSTRLDSLVQLIHIAIEHKSGVVRIDYLDSGAPRIDDKLLASLFPNPFKQAWFSLKPPKVSEHYTKRWSALAVRPSNPSIKVSASLAPEFCHRDQPRTALLAR